MLKSQSGYSISALTSQRAGGSSRGHLVCVASGNGWTWGGVKGRQVSKAQEPFRLYILPVVTCGFRDLPLSAFSLLKSHLPVWVPWNFYLPLMVLS